MSGSLFSSSELGKRLRELRQRVRLTQDETADRMGLSGQHRRKTIERLERGRINNPSVDTICRFLRACGALWGEITGILDSREPVPIDTQAITDSKLSPEDTQRLESAIEKQVRKYETRLAAPIGGEPMHPARQAGAVRKLRNYRIVVVLMEQAVAELLADKPVVSIEYPRYKAVAREALGLLWREVRASQKSKVKSQNRPEGGGGGSQKSKGESQDPDGSEKLRAKSKEQKSKSKDEGSQKAEAGSQKLEARRQNEEERDFRVQTTDCGLQNGGIAGRLARKAEYWGTQKLDPELVREVQGTVLHRFAALQETNPELLPS